MAIEYRAHSPEDNYWLVKEITRLQVENARLKEAAPVPCGRCRYWQASACCTLHMCAKHGDYRAADEYCSDGRRKGENA